MGTKQQAFDRALAKHGLDDLSVGRASENERLRIALRNLSNEVLGSLPLMEPLARREFGNTNYDILIQRAEEARTILSE